MLFGELVIPSTRALWDDEIADLEEYEPANIQWESANVSVDSINTLYVADTPIVIKLFEKCILTGLNPINASKVAGVRVYKFNEDIVILYEHKMQFTSGEIIQHISQFIEKAKKIHGITSSSIALYQGDNAPLESMCFIRSLSTVNGPKADIPKLPIPNLVTGITANLLSYCVHTNRDCQLFIGFMEQAPLDSINSEPFLSLFKKIGLEIKSCYNLILQAPSNNLYM
ncbi:hypothetical protein Trydic_g6645 [Trypoxylus dichotomus]